MWIFSCFSSLWKFVVFRDDQAEMAWSHPDQSIRSYITLIFDKWMNPLVVDHFNNQFFVFKERQAKWSECCGQNETMEDEIWSFRKQVLYILWKTEQLIDSNICHWSFSVVFWWKEIKKSLISASKMYIFEPLINIFIPKQQINLELQKLMISCQLLD